MVLAYLRELDISYLQVWPHVLARVWELWPNLSKITWYGNNSHIQSLDGFKYWSLYHVKELFMDAKYVSLDAGSSYMFIFTVPESNDSASKIAY